MNPSYDRTKVHTQSSLQQFKRCPYAYKRAYIDGVEQPETPAMALGTAYHRAMESYINGAPWVAAKDAVMLANPCFEIELIDLFRRTEDDRGDPPDFAFGENLNAEFEILFDGFAGTVDLLGMNLSAEELHIIDWKTGQMRPGNPLGDFQMMFYGWLAVSKVAKIETVNLVIYNPRFGIQESGPIAAEAFELFYQEEVVPIVQKIEEAKRWLRAGYVSDFPQTQNEYCGNCHFRSECEHYESVGALVDTLSADPGKPSIAAASFPTTLANQDDALRFLLLKPLISAWLNDKAAEVRTIVERDGPITHEGRTYGLREKKRHTVDVMKLATIFKAHGRKPADILDIAKVSKTALFKSITGKDNKALRDAVSPAISSEPDGDKLEWRKS